MPPHPRPEKPTEWMAGSLCGPEHQELLFPSDRSKTASAAMEFAIRTLCSQCPVRADCLDYATTKPYERHGVWGGMTPDERRNRIRRRLKRERMARYPTQTPDTTKGTA